MMLLNPSSIKSNRLRHIGLSIRKLRVELLVRMPTGRSFRSLQADICMSLFLEASGSFWELPLQQASSSRKHTSRKS